MLAELATCIYMCVPLLRGDLLRRTSACPHMGFKVLNLKVSAESYTCSRARASQCCACGRHTETTMQRVLSLNQALVESFAEPLILASSRQQQQQMLPPDQDIRGNAAEHMEACSLQRGCASEQQQQQLQQCDTAGGCLFHNCPSMTGPSSLYQQEYLHRYFWWL